MLHEHHSLIENWTETDLLELPSVETDDYEYKSSRIADMLNYRSELAAKLCKAASAFWNTGGGIFIAGVDDRGIIDGGLPAMMGKQKLRDWVDQTLASVTPTGPYTVKTFERELDDSRILPGHVILVVAFGESFDLPHMAHDNRYYVRAGAHSNPANHYLVEAIRARRGLRRPMLRALLREHPHKHSVIELVILALNDLPALNVKIWFEPKPEIYRKIFQVQFPINIPVIDRNHPFALDVATMKTRQKWLGSQPLCLQLQYEGILGTIYQESQYLDHHSFTPIQLATRRSDKPEKTLKKISAQLARLNDLLETHLKTENTLQNHKKRDP